MQVDLSRSDIEFLLSALSTEGIYYGENAYEGSSRQVRELEDFIDREREIERSFKDAGYKKDY